MTVRVHTGSTEAPLAALGRRVGILGGTFDPVHLGHLTIAASVGSGFLLDSVLFIPAASPPHKRGQGLTLFGHRFAMLSLAVREQDRFFLSDLEASRSGPSYSVDTLRRLRRSLDRRVELFFILGLDAFVEINTWKQYDRLARHTHLVVIDRPPFRRERMMEVIRNHFPGFRYDPEAEAWTAPPSPNSLYLFDTEPLEISSTEIRRRVGAGEPIRDLVPPAVAEYIRLQGLYRG